MDVHHSAGTLIFTAPVETTIPSASTASILAMAAPVLSLTIAPALSKLGEGAAFGQLAIQGAIEDAVLDLLDDEPGSTVRAA